MTALLTRAAAGIAARLRHDHLGLRHRRGDITLTEECWCGAARTVITTTTGARWTGTWTADPTARRDELAALLAGAVR